MWRKSAKFRCYLTQKLKLGKKNEKVNNYRRHDDKKWWENNFKEKWK